MRARLICARPAAVSSLWQMLAAFAHAMWISVMSAWARYHAGSAVSQSVALDPTTVSRLLLSRARDPSGQQTEVSSSCSASLEVLLEPPLLGDVAADGEHFVHLRER